MKVRLAVVTAVLMVAAFSLWRESGRALAPPPGEPTSASPQSPRPRVAATSSSPTLPRDPFRFADDEPVARTSQPHSPAPVATPVVPEPPPPRVRLVGLVRREGGLRAALAVDGEIVLASAGDTIGGFRVLWLDPERGVRVRDPEGLEATLSLPEEP